MRWREGKYQYRTTVLDFMKCSLFHVMNFLCSQKIPEDFCCCSVYKSLDFELMRKFWSLILFYINKIYFSLRDSYRFKIQFALNWNKDWCKLENRNSFNCFKAHFGKKPLETHDNQAKLHNLAMYNIGINSFYHGSI